MAGGVVEQRVANRRDQRLVGESGTNFMLRDKHGRSSGIGDWQEVLLN